MSVLTAEVLLLPRLMANLPARFFFFFCLLWYDHLLFAVFLNENCDTPNILVLPAEIPNKYFVCSMSYFTNISVKSFGTLNEAFSGRIPLLSFDSTCLKATHNPPSQWAGEVCL